MSFLRTVERIPPRFIDIVSHQGYRNYVVHKLLRPFERFQYFGYDFRAWDRIEQQKSWTSFMKEVNISELVVLEISPGSNRTWYNLGHKSYTSTEYPEFDICNMRLDREFDIVIADNVFEHLERPYSAGRNIYFMLRDGGHFLIATPFLVRVHGSPDDYTRWTEKGLASLLRECGFIMEKIETFSWGNRSCAKAFLCKSGWPEYGFGKSLINEPEFPISVWAFATK